MGKANSERHDPYASPKMIVGKIKPHADKTPKGIGGQRDSKNVLKSEGQLPQDLIQNNLYRKK